LLSSELRVFGERTIDYDVTYAFGDDESGCRGRKIGAGFA